MTDMKNATNEQLVNAERMASYFSSFPKQKQKIIVMVANAFMQGLTTRSSLEDIDTRKDA